MHFHFALTAVQILWTLTFAALLVLLTVLFGRERVRRFPWFTASIGLLTLRLLADRLLYGHMAPIPLSAVFFTLADLAVLLDLLVLLEVARRAFAGAPHRAFILTAAATVAVAAAVILASGPWPAWKTVIAPSELAHIRFMQMVSQKGDLLAAVLAIELGILIAFLGRRFHAGWRSHPQRVVIGLSTAAMSLLATRAMLQFTGAHAVIRNHTEYNRVIALQSRIANANSAIYFGVLLWWIATFWIDEPAGMDAGSACPKPAKFNIST